MAEMYAVEVSPDLMSSATDAVVTEAAAWQQRPLESTYPVIFFDALRVKIRDEATVRSQAVYLALAVLPNGTRDILGLRIERPTADLPRPNVSVYIRVNPWPAVGSVSFRVIRGEPSVRVLPCDPWRAVGPSVSSV